MQQLTQLYQLVLLRPTQLRPGRQAVAGSLAGRLVQQCRGIQQHV
jgi:hypothetical protein